MTRSLRGVILLTAALAAGGCALLDRPVEPPRPRPTDTASQLYERAMEQYRRGDYARARDLFHEYIGSYQGTPLDFIVMYYLGHCYQMLGSAKEARVLLERVATRGSDDFWGAQALARIRQIEGDQ